MYILVILVVALIICIYLFFRSKNKFTRGGDINRQGEDMNSPENGFDDPKDE